METKRLILRELEEKDSKELSKQGNTEEVNFFTEYISFPFTEEDAKKLILERIEDAKLEERKFYEFAIVLKETNEIIGLTSIYNYNKKDGRALIGYWLGKEHRGKGYISEAVEELIKFGKEKLKLHKLSATVVKGNKKSMNVLKKFNFRKVGIKKEDKLLNGKYYDIVLLERIFESQ